MIFLLTWTILFLVLSVGTLLLRYWIQLFQHQDQYTRRELLDVPEILGEKFRELFFATNPFYGGLASLFSVLLGWVLTLLGGLFTPSIPPSPDFAIGGPSNYFFQSFFILIVIRLSMPLLKDLTPGKSNTPAALIAKTTNPVIFFLAMTLSALTLASWGVYHESSFLYAFFNTILSAGIALFTLSQHKPTEDPEEEFENEDLDEDYGEDLEKEPGYDQDSPSSSEVSEKDPADPSDLTLDDEDLDLEQDDFDQIDVLDSGESRKDNTDF